MSVFGSQEIPFKTRVSLLEERLSAYDEVSKQMLTKLEQAVEKISESNNNISQILIRHDERIEKAAEDSSDSLRNIEKTKTELKDEIKTLSDNFSRTNRFIWMGLGMAALSSVLLSQIELADFFFPPSPRAPYQYEYAWPNRNFKQQAVSCATHNR